MPQCIVRDCRNSSNPKRKTKIQIEEEKYRKISYHRFPRDQYKRKIWLVVLGLVNWDPPKTATICSNHFNEDDFLRSKRRTLKRTAVPVPALHNIYDEPVNDVSPVSEGPKSTYSISNVEPTTSFTPSRSHSSENIIDGFMNNLSPVSENLKSTCSLSLAKVNSATCFTLSRSYSSTIIHDEPVNNLSPISKAPNATYSVLKVDSSTSITPSRLHNSPGKKRIREVYTREISRLRQKLYDVKQNIARDKKRIEIMSKILQSAKEENPQAFKDLKL